MWLEIETQVKRNRQCRRKAKRKESECDVLAEPEAEARKGIGGRHPEQQRKDDRRSRQQHAVAEIAHEGDIEIARRRLQRAGDESLVVRYGRLEEQARRDSEDRLIGLERHEKD